MRSAWSRRILLLVLALPAALLAQSVTQAVVPGVDESRLTVLNGTVHALARSQFDRGVVPDDFPMRRMLVMLQRPPEHEAALQRFLREVHTPGSPNFHQWMTPAAYGRQFGAKDEDIATVSAWLQAYGFSVARVTTSRTMIEFSGTAAQVREALHTDIHEYVAVGKSFFANDRDISVPQAISSRIRNFAPLNTFPPASYMIPAGKATHTRAPGGAGSQFTLTENNAPFYALAPEDFSTQYDLGPVYAAGSDGSGETIGIIGTSNINLELVDAYRTLFSLPADHTQVVIDGEDLGDGLGPNIEALLDVELSGAVARNATINFYVSGGNPFQSNLVLAALRAIEDNQASVLSLSYGECEPLLGDAGNQLWASLWEQAAAQGQTVLVSSGDTGPATCPNVLVIDSAGAAEAFGLTVNGLSSTPWNVSVGGTDFYYSDYATGGASIATLWNQTNDANLGSLKATLPEQPWDDALGLNIVPYIGGPYGFVLPSPAGGGGSSNCTQQTGELPNSLPSCTAGYAKPVWQQATGVPNDGVRDLPDISLFASNGQNLSAWPICAEPGDCASGATSTVTLVGGTSTSTPAMAGIMALVNQKYGRQGQADFTLYALARQQAPVFHDITLGTNDILCLTPLTIPTSSGLLQVPVPNCTVPYSNPYFPNLYSFGVYTAGAGYDQASGLGSVDANQLISNWNSVVLLPTSTSLQLSPTSITHGSPITVNATVAASSGSGVPTGDIILQTSPVTAMRGNAPIALTNGAASGNVTTLPGGSYQVVAQYGGDGVFGASTSSPVSVKVTPEQSSTTLTAQYVYLVQGPPEQFQGGTIANGGQVPFGSLVTYDATPIGLTSNSSGLATGSVTFTDGSTSATVPLAVNGVASWTPQAPALGSHSVTASYSGDASYMASTATPLTYTLVKGTPTLAAEVLETPPVFSCTTVCTSDFLAGSNLVVHVLLKAADSNVAPTGTVTVNLGTLTQTVPVVADSYINENLSTGYVTFTSVPAGTYSLTANYSGDSNWNATSYTSSQTLTFVTSSSVATSTTTLTVSPSSVNSSGSVTFNFTVTASTDQYGTPVGTVALLGNGTFFAAGIVGGSGVVTQSQTETGSVTVPADAIPIGTLSVVGLYSGAPGVASSVSAPVTLNVTASDFTFSTGASSLTVKSGQTGTVPLLLGGPYGINVPVTLACAPSSNLFTCNVNPASSTVNGSAVATLTISAESPATAAQTTLPSHSNHWLAFAFGSIFAFGAVLVLPCGRRKVKAQVILLLLFSALSFVACSSGSSTTVNSNPTPTGTYSVIVTATANGIEHNVSLPVLVSGQ